jgi:hypothetical protein
MFDVQVMHVLRSSDRGDAPVSDGAKTRLADLNAEWDVLLAEYDSIVNGDIAALNRLLRDAGINPVVVSRWKYRKTLFSKRGQMVRGEPRRGRRTSRRAAEGTHCEVFARNSVHQAPAEF